jgi:hypothetical protein
MSRFEITTPVPNYTGNVAGVQFTDGRAVIDASSEQGKSVLSYFVSQRYGVRALDDMQARELLAQGGVSPADEAAQLRRELKALDDEAELDKLRKEVRAKRKEVRGGDEQAPTDEQAPAATLSPGVAAQVRTDDDGKAPAEINVEPLAPPAESASEAKWRAWVVDSGRLSEDEAKSAKKADIIETHAAAYDRERAARLKAETEVKP